MERRIESDRQTLLTISEVAEWLGCTERMVWKLNLDPPMCEVPPDDRSPRLGGNHVSYGTTTTEQGSAVVYR